MSNLRRLLPIVAFAGAAGCAAGGVDPEVATIKTRASFDLNCPEQEVRGRWLDDKTVGVTACGRRATYVKVCRGGPTWVDDCQWISNSDSHSARDDR